MPETNNPPIDDMVDDLTKWPLMHAQLSACAEILAKPYVEADTAAVQHQWLHRTITLVAALCGTAAVLLAIISLARILPEGLVLAFEVIAVLIALAAVGLGIYAASQARWLEDRHRAERCRLLKFQFLIDPEVWTDRPDDFARRVARLRDDLDATQKTSMHHWIDEDDLPDMPAVPRNADYSPTALKQLIEYYLLKRVNHQMDFFSSRTRGNTSMDRWTRHIPPIFFFISVIAALVHFVYDIVRAGHETPAAGLGHISMGLIVVAASMPVLGAGVRTVRTAYEFARNTVRYRAKLVTLKRLHDRLPTEVDPLIVFHDLWHCEQVLESEHREWLRLMIDAEWFG